MYLVKRLKYFGSLQEITISNFFGKKTLQQQDEKKRNHEKRIFSRSDNNHRGSGLVLQTKITYIDFLKNDDTQYFYS